MGTNLPAESPVLIQSGLATLAMAKMSAARKRHPDITLSLSMSVVPGGLLVCLVLARREAGHSGDSGVGPFLLSRHRRHPSLSI